MACGRHSGDSSVGLYLWQSGDARWEDNNSSRSIDSRKVVCGNDVLILGTGGCHDTKDLEYLCQKVVIMKYLEVISIREFANLCQSTPRSFR